MNKISAATSVSRDKAATGSKKSFMDSINAGKTCVWNKKVKDTQMEKFKIIINSKYGTNHQTYWDLHEWSVQNYPQFWEEILKFFNVIYSGSYQEVAKKLSQSLIDVDWFSGAKINYAENLLRFRDNRTALICANDKGTEEKVTYAQLYEEVKMYAAAFKNLGLQKGDRVACYMENRKEAIFAMLAAVSLGAIWGGASPFYAAQPASNIIRPMKPKFFITMGTSQYNNTGCNILKNVRKIVYGLDSLIKVIIVPNTPESLDISGIEKSCFLKEFLAYGKNSDGAYPEMTFLQLPFNHPVCINFTSGTTGLPKGMVHSAVGLLPLLRDMGLHADIKRMDVVLSESPVGWITWDFFTCTLAVGATVVLYNGNPFVSPRYGYWNLLAEYKVTRTLMTPHFVDQLEKNGCVPGPDCDLQHLKMITIGASPVKLQNFRFLQQYVMHDNLFIGVAYGASETFGYSSGYDLNSPVYSGEVQVSALGLDLRCFDELGNSIIGERGEVVIASPFPGLPLCVWNDENNEILNDLYFSKYNGIWHQHDECWIDPETKGIVIIGRSDDTMTPKGLTFNAVDIYCIIHDMEELADYLCCSQSSFQLGHSRCILFIKLKPKFSFSQDIVKKIKMKIETELSVEHVPEIVLEAQEIPYNLNTKKMEKVVKAIIETNKIPEVSNVKNPSCLLHFLNIPELQNY